MSENLLGARLKAVRAMTQQELDEEGWHASRMPPVALELDNGAVLYASRDDEGNGPGALFGKDQNGSFRLVPAEEPQPMASVHPLKNKGSKRKSG